MADDSSGDKSEKASQQKLRKSRQEGQVVRSRDLATAIGILVSLKLFVYMLPAYLVGMVLAGTVGKDHTLVRRLRTLTLGFLTPFYFIKAGLYVSLPSLATSAGLVITLLAVKMAAKLIRVWPLARAFGLGNRESNYTTLLMATGLTFGTISALFGLENHLINQTQYTVLVTVVILSAVVPTLIAQSFFLPAHEVAQRIRSRAASPRATVTAIDGEYEKRAKGE